MPLVEIHSLSSAFVVLLGFIAIVFGANFMDCSMRSMAERKAIEAEAARFQKWGLPPAKR